MSAQRRNATTNRRARGSAARKSVNPPTVDTAVESSPVPVIAVAEPPAKASVPSRVGPRMAAREQGGRQSERLNGIKQYIADTRAELRRVTWPDQVTLRNLTIVVIAVSAVMGLLLGGIDFVLLRVFEAL
jgi:preprotein translocase subunit SecE